MTDQRPDVEEGDAAELNFPPEFAQAETLLNAEVSLLLKHRKEEDAANEHAVELSEVFMKTLEYTNRMAKYKNRSAMRAVRQILSSKNFHRFELVQLANLCPDTAEEAKSLIPSLENKIEDDDLEELLKELRTKKTFQ